MKANQSAFDIAKDIVSKSKSPFVDDSTVIAWIAAELMECEKISKEREHNRIEKVIGTASDKQLKEIVKIARFKHRRVFNKQKKENPNETKISSEK